MDARTLTTIGTVALAAGLILSAPAYAQQMPVAQQNALVQKYCAVCHTDAHKNGGLSLQHFDAAQAEPSLAAMMASKVKNGAFGAAGLKLPDRSTEEAFLAALTAKSAGADEWTLTRSKDLLTASVLRRAPATEELYRLKLTCRTDTREPEIQLSWSPDPGPAGRTMSVAVDDRSPVNYLIEAGEKMGNGAKDSAGKDVVSGPAAAVLHATPFPTRTLTISKLFPDESVVFPFDRLTQTMRQELSVCFSSR